MIKYFSYIFLLFTAISCTSLDAYLKEKNLITQNDHIKYVEIKEKKEEIKTELESEPEIKTEEVEEKKQEVKATIITSAKSEKEIKSSIIKSDHLVKDQKIMNEGIKKVTKPVTEVEKENTEVIVNFDETDLKIVKFIAEQVVENEEQVKRKTIESIQKLESKGYKYSAREFLAKAYDNIKKTNVNSYILAAARVMNSIERDGK
ncbi:hypothetical protein [Streptobacillus notomytis]|uniref:hypothetical protein n=1 Tax=Streptobacillus notomytis TaxID=1712031 RepID=UPI000937C302|nr:hypothetical protein [Streptobacillus notomytis]